jgi:hypothetical protein
MHQDHYTDFNHSSINSKRVELTCAHTNECQRECEWYIPPRSGRIPQVEQLLDYGDGREHATPSPDISTVTY